MLQKVCTNVNVPPDILQTHKGKVCASCVHSSDGVNLKSLSKEKEDKILRQVVQRLNKLDRDCHDLSRAVRKISRSLYKVDPDYDLWDKLVDVSAAGSAPKKMPSPPTSSGQPKTDALISGAPMETEINIPDAIPNPLPQGVVSQSSVDITHNKKWGIMHNKRLASLVKSAPSAKNRLPSMALQMTLRLMLV